MDELALHFAAYYGWAKASHLNEEIGEQKQRVARRVGDRSRLVASEHRTMTPIEPVGLLIGGDRITAVLGRAPSAHLPGDRTTECDRSRWQASPRSTSRSPARREAQREWMSLTVDRRRDLLIDLADTVHDHLDELAALNVHDYAVPISFAGNRHLLERFLRHFAGYVDKPHGTSTPVNGSFDVNLIEREPYGVVGVIAPWNGALAVAGACVAPCARGGQRRGVQAVRAGAAWPRCASANCASRRVCRPGWSTSCPPVPKAARPWCAIPASARSTSPGAAPPLARVVQAAAANLTPVVAELGGKSANIIFDDADLDAAAMLSAHQGPLMQSGQSCACASRLLVHESVYDAFVEKFLGIIDAAKVGDPFDPAVTSAPSSVARQPIASSA